MIKDDPEVVNAPNKEQIAPLVMAVARGTPATVDLLIRHGATINTHQGTCRSTALITAVIRHRQDNAVVLLRHGADVNMKDGEGRTAVDIASGLGYIEIERVLKKYGASRGAEHSVMISMHCGRQSFLIRKDRQGLWYFRNGGK
jgi:ankyrin repeat protein